MKFGCAALPSDYELLCELGFDFIELPCRLISAMDTKQFTQLCHKITTGKIYCGGFNIYCPPEIIIAGPGFSLESARSYAVIAAKRAHALGCMNIGIGSPNSRRLPDGFDRALALNQLCDFLKVTADEFGKYGITVCFEALGPCYCNFVNHLSQAVDVVKSIGYENVKVVADFYNMEHSGEADIDLNFATPYIHHAHISDDDNSPSRRYFLKPEKYPVHETRLRHLKSCSYDRSITLEIDLPVDRELASRDLAFLKRAWG